MKKELIEEKIITDDLLGLSVAIKKYTSGQLIQIRLDNENLSERIFDHLHRHLDELSRQLDPV